MSPTLILKAGDIDSLVGIIAEAAAVFLVGTPQQFFQNLLAAAHLPSAWTRPVAGRWTGNPEYDARRLIEWAIQRGTNPDDPRFTALGAILRAFLAQQLDPEASQILVAAISGYRLIHDDELLDDLRVRYQVPVFSSKNTRNVDYGPDIYWRGPSPDLELQGFLQPDPPWQDVGFLHRAMAVSNSVCRVQAGRDFGTGFLVAPKLVLTNYHVLAPNPGDDPVASVGNTMLSFGAFTDSGNSVFTEYKAVRLIEQSPVADLDFVLIEVEAMIENNRAIRRARLDQTVPPVRSAISILHHPGGGAMKLSTSHNGVTGVYVDRGHIQYVTSTAEGSSGSPCFNNDWKVVALHHAQRARSFGSIREGILIGNILNRIRRHLTTEPEETSDES